jgi:hypothetical protein
MGMTGSGFSSEGEEREEPDRPLGFSLTMLMVSMAGGRSEERTRGNGEDGEDGGAEQEFKVNGDSNEPPNSRHGVGSTVHGLTLGLEPYIGSSIFSSADLSLGSDTLIVSKSISARRWRNVRTSFCLALR